MAKKKITAKELADDIRNGMDDNALIQKYEISSNQLHGLFNQLIKAGVLKQEEIDARSRISKAKEQPAKSEEALPEKQESDKQNEEKTKKKRVITIGWILSWLFGGLFFLTGLGTILRAPLAGLLFFVMAALLIPPIIRKIEDKSSIKLSRSVKALLLIVCFVFIGILVPSQDNSKKSSPASNSASQLSKAPATVAKIGDTVTLDDSEWTVLEAMEKGDILYSNNQFQESAKTEGKFIMVVFKITNKTKKEERIVNEPKVIDSQGREFSQYDMQSFYIPNYGKAMTLETLPPSMPKTFYGVYELPKDSTGLKFQARSLSMWGDKKLIDLGL